MPRIPMQNLASADFSISNVMLARRRSRWALTSKDYLFQQSFILCLLENAVNLCWLWWMHRHTWILQWEGNWQHNREWHFRPLNTLSKRNQEKHCLKLDMWCASAHFMMKADCAISKIRMGLHLEPVCGSKVFCNFFSFFLTPFFHISF